jgi:hypothetical protein
MSYDDERPADWSTYDRVASATADLKFLFFEMQGSKESLRFALGPNNYERAREYLDCIQLNLKKLGKTSLLFATSVLTQSPDDPVVRRVLDRVQSRIAEDDVNGAWNHVEAWLAGREITEDDA